MRLTFKTKALIVLAIAWASRPVRTILGLLAAEALERIATDLNGKLHTCDVANAEKVRKDRNVVPIRRASI